MNIRTSEVLDLAADKIQEHGWTKGTAGWDEGAGLCLEGAINAALGNQYSSGDPQLNRCDAAEAVRNYLDLGPQPSVLKNQLWKWNDMVAGSQERVIEVLRAAALVESTKEKAYETEDQPLPVHIPASVA